MSAKELRVFKAVLWYALLVVLSLVFLYPIYMLVVNAISPSGQIIERGLTGTPKDVSLEPFRTAWNEGNLSLYVKNSLVVSTVITVGQVATAVLAAYAFAFLEFPLKRSIFFVFLASTAVPFEVTIVANVATISGKADFPFPNLYDTYAALALPFLATGFGAFLLRQTFLTLPRDLRDAARLDGFGNVRFLTSVAVPLARPMIASLALFAFFGAWNQYLWPLLVTRDEQLRTVQIGIAQLVTTQLDEFNVSLAGTVIAFLPLLVLLLLFQKQIVRGLTAGAVKG